jgi:hypothetical protein
MPFAGFFMANISYPNSAPRLIISSSDIIDNLSQTPIINFKFISSKVIIDFSGDDISAIGGIIRDFSGNNREYSAIFESNDIGLKTIYIDAGSFTDKFDNSNNDISFSWTFNDEKKPIITIDSINVIDGSKTDISMIDFSFVSSKIIIDFSQNDISAIGGTIKDFSKNDNINYTMTFESSSNHVGEKSVIINAGSFTDLMGLSNDEISFNWIYDDKESLMMTINSINVIDGSRTDISMIDFSFISSKVTYDFSQSDISAIGGTIIDFSKIDNINYNVTFESSSNHVGKKSVIIYAGSFKDVVDNSNGDISFNWIYDDKEKPTMTINYTSVIDDSKTNISMIDFSFVSSKVTDFNQGDISAIGGSITDFSNIDNINYTMIFESSSNHVGDKSIIIYAGSFKDEADNSNNEISFNWIYDDEEKPTMTINSVSVIDNSKTNISMIDFSFVSSKVTDFNQGDISAIGGSITDFSNIDNINYTMIFESSSNHVGEKSVIIYAGSFKDEADNSNNEISFNWIYDDEEKPTMIINSESIIDGSTSDISIDLSFVSSKVTDFSQSDISAIGGSITDFSNIDNINYKITFESSSNYRGEKSVIIYAGSFKDAVDNSNDDISFSWIMLGINWESMLAKEYYTSSNFSFTNSVTVMARYKMPPYNFSPSNGHNITFPLWLIQPINNSYGQGNYFNTIIMRSDYVKSNNYSNIYQYALGGLDLNDNLDFNNDNLKIRSDLPQANDGFFIASTYDYDNNVIKIFCKDYTGNWITTQKLNTDFANSQNNEFTNKQWRVRFGGTAESDAFNNDTQSPGAGRTGFEGQIANMYVFEGVLTQSEIENIEFGNGLPSSTEHPVLFNGNNATIQDNGLSTFTVYINPYQYAAPDYDENKSDPIYGLNGNPYDGRLIAEFTTTDYFMALASDGKIYVTKYAGGSTPKLEFVVDNSNRMVIKNTHHGGNYINYYVGSNDDFTPYPSISFYNQHDMGYIMEAIDSTDNAIILQNYPLVAPSGHSGTYGLVERHSSMAHGEYAFIKYYHNYSTSGGKLLVYRVNSYALSSDISDISNIYLSFIHP